MAPHTASGAEEHIFQALELTHMDSVLKTVAHKTEAGYPSNLNDYRSESYAAQYRRLQERFESLWDRAEPAPKLYYIQAWTAGFKCWKNALD